MRKAKPSKMKNFLMSLLDYFLNCKDYFKNITNNNLGTVIKKPSFSIISS